MKPENPYDNSPEVLLDFFAKVDKYSKQIAIAGIALAALIIGLGVGFQVLYLLAGVSGIAVYTFFPEQMEQWFDDNQALLLGGACGFLYAGPLGLAIGGWLGHFLNQKYLQFSEKANQLSKIFKPFSYVSNLTTTLFPSLKTSAKKETPALQTQAIISESENVSSSHRWLNQVGSFIGTQVASVTHSLAQPTAFVMNLPLFRSKTTAPIEEDEDNDLYYDCFDHFVNEKFDEPLKEKLSVH